MTGDGRWLISTTAPAGAWTEVLYDDSAWAPAYSCPPIETNVWGTYWAGDLLTYGATWIWSGSCRDLGEVWFRLNID